METFSPRDRQLELESLAWGATLWWDKAGIPGLPHVGSASWQTFLQMRNEMISLFPPWSHLTQPREHQGWKSSSVLLPTGTVPCVASSPQPCSADSTTNGLLLPAQRFPASQEGVPVVGNGEVIYQHRRQCFFPGAWRAGLGSVTSQLLKMHVGCWVVRATKMPGSCSQTPPFQQTKYL